MKINIEVGVDGAKRAASRADVCVVIDTLRCSTTIVTALQLGVQSIKPLNDLSELTEIPCIGENQGKKLPGCQFNNSPGELMACKQLPKQLAIISTNGVPCILACIQLQADILIGSIVNAKAVAKMAECIAMKKKKNISLILAGRKNTVENDDKLAAILIRKTLNSLPQPFSNSRLHKTLLKTNAAKNLVRLGYQHDIEYAAMQNSKEAVPFYDYVSGSITSHPDACHSEPGEGSPR